MHIAHSTTSHVACTLLLMVSSGAILRADDGPNTALETYVNDDAGFQADMFPNPEYDASSEKFKDGDTEVTIDTHSIMSIEGQIVYSVTITQIPQLQSSPEKDPAAIIRGRLDAAIKRFGGGDAEKQEEPVTHDGLKGTELRIDNPTAKISVLVRVLLADNRVYQLLALGASEAIHSKQTRQFFDSFRRLNDEVEANSKLARYMNIDAGFQADMFPRPKHQVNHTPGTAHDTGVTIESHAIVSTSEGTGYMVNVSDLPRFDSSNPKDVQTVLRASIDDLIKKFKQTTKEYELAITHDGMKGLEVRLVDAAKKEGVRMRMFFKDNHIYTLLAVGTPADISSKQSDQFLDSLRLLKNTTISDEATLPLKKYVNEAAGFRADMFQNPKHNHSTSHGKGMDAEVTLHSHTVLSSHDSTIHSVEVTDIPRFDSSNDNDWKFIVDTFSDQTVKKYEKVTQDKRESAVVSRSMRGRELRLSSPATKEAVRVRIFFKEGHVYQITAAGSAQIVDSIQTDRFLNSFMLVKQVASETQAPSPSLPKSSDSVPKPEPKSPEKTSTDKEISREKAIQLLRDF